MNKNKKRIGKTEKDDKKNIMLYFASFVFLVISCIFFGYAFYFESQIVYYFFTILFFVFFCISYFYFNKKITCTAGYNLIQAYLFYEKCKKNGVSAGNSKADSDRLKIDDDKLKAIRDVATKYDYAAKLNDEQVKELYKTGRKVSRYLNKKN